MDKCEMCLGAKGGVPGNENRLGGVVVCDFCTALYLRMLAAARRADGQPFEPCATCARYHANEHRIMRGGE